MALYRIKTLVDEDADVYLDTASGDQFALVAKEAPTDLAVGTLAATGVVSGTTITGTKLAVSAPSGIGLEMSGVYTGHMVYLHPTSMASGKRAIRIGDYGTELPIVAGEGIIRSYVKVTSGTDATALQFHWGFTESAAPLIGSQMQIESACATPGPTGLIVADFIGGIQAAKYIAAGGDGFVGVRSKIYADVSSVCSGDAYALWLDSQISCAVSGTEASIKGTTGGSVPDAFIWLNTTSSGWGQFLYLDATMASQSPFVASGCSVTVASVPYLKVLVGTTQYGIPLIAI